MLGGKTEYDKWCDGRNWYVKWYAICGVMEGINMGYVVWLEEIIYGVMGGINMWYVVWWEEV